MKTISPLSKITVPTYLNIQKKTFTLQEEYRNKVAILEQQLACTEDELCEARLLASKLNTELISERSSAEVRLAEMQSRLNEVSS